MAETIKNTRLRVADGEGDYIVYHPQTNTNMVLYTSGDPITTIIADLVARVDSLERELYNLKYPSGLSE